MKFLPQPIEALQAQYRRLLDRGEVVVMSEHDGIPSLHDERLPWFHVFDFQTGLVLCLSLERAPYIALPDQEVDLDPGRTYLHALASWAEGYRQPGPDPRDYAPEEITEEVIDAVLAAACADVRHAVAVLRGTMEAAEAEYIDEAGFLHALFRHHAGTLIHRAEA